MSLDGQIDFTPVRRHQQLGALTGRLQSRTDSPVGMLEEGFQGLYGGQENGSDDQLWTEGVRSSNVEVRSWNMRDGRENETGWNGTPERELSRSREG
jgi:hypothetical protein